MKVYLAILSLFFFFTGIVTAQNPQGQAQDTTDLYNFVLRKYGFDHQLVNGVRLYNLYRHVISHPYFSGEESLPGSATLSGKHFDNLLINYDIYNQWLVLEYRELSGGINKIILEPLHTDGFQIDGYTFEKMTLDEHGELFWQVISADGITCYIHWKKQLLTLSNNIHYAEEFSNSFRYYFLEYNGTLYPFSNRRNFASIFPGSAGREARMYMRKNRLRFRKITVSEMNRLINYISSIQ